MTKEEEKELMRRLEKLQSKLSESETDRRLAALEKSVSELNSRIFDGHKWFVTVLFSAVAVMLTFFGLFSRWDVKDSTAAMERRVDEKTREMELKVQTIVGDALKKPSLELLYDQLPLDGQTIELNASGNISPTTFYLNSLFLRNSGQKRTDPVSMVISTSRSFDLNWSPQQWEGGQSFDKNYAEAISSTRHTTIDAGETVNVQQLALSYDPFRSPITSNILCKMEVFYGGQKSAEAKFQLRVKVD